MSDCLFCKIVNGEIPSAKVYEDEYVYAFNDIDPKAPTHILFIPKQHIGSAAEIDDEKIEEAISKVAKQSGFENGFRIVSNVGESAGQTVHHLHFHVLSGRDMTWPPG